MRRFLAFLLLVMLTLPAQARTAPEPSLPVDQLLIQAAREYQLDLQRVSRWRQEEARDEPRISDEILLAGADRLSGAEAEQAELLGHVMPFYITPAVKAFALRNTRTAATSYQKILELLQAIYHVRDLSTIYEAGRSRTAHETLLHMRGNCFALTNLLVASARALGVEARYLDATRSSAAVRQEGTVMLLARHIVAEVQTSMGPMVVDFYEVNRTNERFWYQPLSDREVVSLYLSNLGYESLQHGEDAEPFFRASVALGPTLSTPWNNLAAWLQRQERTTEVESLLQEAIALKSSSFAPHFNLGRLYLATNRPADAQHCFERAILKRANSPVVFYQLGMSYLLQGKKGRAYLAFNRALHLDSSMEVAQYKVDRFIRQQPFQAIYQEEEE